MKVSDLTLSEFLVWPTPSSMSQYFAGPVLCCFLPTSPITCLLTLNTSAFCLKVITFAIPVAVSHISWHLGGICMVPQYSVVWVFLYISFCYYCHVAVCLISLSHQTLWCRFLILLIKSWSKLVFSGTVHIYRF